jgi:hypothetical protein
VEEGSFVELLALPETDEAVGDKLPFSVADLSAQAFDRLLDAIAGDDPKIDSELAEAVAAMAADLGIGDRNSAITLIGVEGAGGAPPRRVVIDGAVRARMQRRSEQSPKVRDETLIGVLFEADFEGNTAKLRLGNGNIVMVSFSPDLADDIQEALRSRARFDGLVRYHPKTSQVIGVELRAVVRGTQLVPDVDSFWQQQTFEELQSAQGITGRLDPRALGIPDLTDDERAAFLAAISE